MCELLIERISRGMWDANARGRDSARAYTLDRSEYIGNYLNIEKIAVMNCKAKKQFDYGIL